MSLCFLLNFAVSVFESWTMEENAFKGVEGRWTWLFTIWWISWKKATYAKEWLIWRASNSSSHSVDAPVLVQYPRRCRGWIPLAHLRNLCILSSPLGNTHIWWALAQIKNMQLQISHLSMTQARLIVQVLFYDPCNYYSKSSLC